MKWNSLFPPLREWTQTLIWSILALISLFELHQNIYKWLARNIQSNYLYTHYLKKVRIRIKNRQRYILLRYSSLKKNKKFKVIGKANTMRMHDNLIRLTDNYRGAVPWWKLSLCGGQALFLNQTLLSLSDVWWELSSWIMYYDQININFCTKN